MNNKKFVWHEIPL